MAFRPTYPPTLFAKILGFNPQQRYSLAVDVATGSGQAIGPLAARFTRVLGAGCEVQSLICCCCLWW